MRINFKTFLAMFLALFFGACIDGKRPEIVRFKATPGEVRAGETVNVSWDVSRADTCQLSGIDVEPVSGYRDLTVYTPQDFTLQCWNANGVSESTITINVIPEHPSSPPVVFNYAYASPNPVPAGGSVILYWSAINADYCLLDDYGIAFEPTWAFQISSVRDENAMHVVTCANAVSSVSRSIIISIIPQPAPPVEIGTLTASPASIVSGATTTLIWTGVTNATSCNINNGVGPANIPSGNKTVSPTVPTTYTLNCTGAGTPASRQVTVTVTLPPAPPPPVTITSFTASPTTITAGSTATLAWSGVTNATACSIDNGVGSVAIPSGSKTVTPTAPTIYTLNCTGAGAPATRSVTVTVTPPPVISLFTASSPSIVLGQSVTLTWAVTGADSCTISGVGPVFSIGGNVSVIPTTPGTFNYTLTCQNLAGLVTAFVSVTVNTPATPPPPPMQTYVPPSGYTATFVWDVRSGGRCNNLGNEKTVCVNGTCTNTTGAAVCENTSFGNKYTADVGWDFGVFSKDPRRKYAVGSSVITVALTYVPWASFGTVRSGTDCSTSTFSGEAPRDFFQAPVTTKGAWVEVVLEANTPVYTGHPELWPDGNAVNQIFSDRQYAASWVTLMNSCNWPGQGCNGGTGTSEFYVARIVTYGKLAP